MEAKAKKLQQSLGRQSNTIGLHFGFDSIKYAQIVPYKGKKTITLVGIQHVNGIEDEDHIVALETLLQNLNIKNSKFVCVLNCPESYALKVLIPVMPYLEIEEAVRWELTNRLSFDFQDSIIQFEIFETIEHEGVKKYSIYAVTMPKKSVENIISLFEAVRKRGSIKDIKPEYSRLVSIIPSSCSVHNLARNDIRKNENADAFLIMGTSITELNVYDGKSLEFSRKLPISEDIFTQSLTTELVLKGKSVKIDKTQAEAIKSKYGIPDHEDDELLEGLITRRQVLGLYRPNLEQLILEIERSLDFYLQELGGRFSKVVLLGGGALLKGLDKYLSDNAEVDVVVGNPFSYVPSIRGLSTDQNVQPARLSVAVGAALDDRKGINFLPKEYKEKYKRSVEKVVVSSLVLLFVGVVCFSILGFYLERKINQTRLTNTEQEYVSIIPYMKELKKNVSLENLVKDKQNWSFIFNEMNKSISQNVFLTNLKMTENELLIKGIVLESDQLKESIVSELMMRLNQGSFKNVKLIKTQEVLKADGRSEFEISCSLE